MTPNRQVESERLHTFALSDNFLDSGLRHVRPFESPGMKAKKGGRNTKLNITVNRIKCSRLDNRPCYRAEMNPH